MRHDWILEVLSDLLSYSQRNGLQGLAHKVECALQTAKVEIDGNDPPPEDEGGFGGGGTGGLRRQ